jgi:hypothetical protein
MSPNPYAEPEVAKRKSSRSPALSSRFRMAASISKINGTFLYENAGGRQITDFQTARRSCEISCE